MFTISCVEAIPRARRRVRCQSWGYACDFLVGNVSWVRFYLIVCQAFEKRFPGTSPPFRLARPPAVY